MLSQKYHQGIKNLNYPRLSFFLALSIILAGIILRIINYTSKAMWWDEVAVLITIKNRSFIDITRQLAYSLHEPLYYYLVKIASFISYSDMATRLPSLISGVATLFAIYYISKRLCGIKISLVATYLLSISAVHIQYSQMLRMYTMLALFCLLSTYFFYRLTTSKGNFKYCLGYVIFTALAINTQILSLTVIAAQVAYILYLALEQIISWVFEQENVLKKRRFSIFAWLLISDALIITLLISRLTSLPLRGPLSQKIIPLLIFSSAFIVTSAILSIIKLSLSPENLTDGRTTINKDLYPVLKRWVLSLLFVAILSPFLVIILFRTIFWVKHTDIQYTFLTESLRQIIKRFNYMVVGQTQGEIFGLSREPFFASVLFITGVIISFVKRKQWAFIFLLYSISIFLFIFLIGYSENSGALSERHLLLALPGIIIFVSAGLIWGLEAIFNFLWQPFKETNQNIGLIAKNVFIMTFSLFILIKDAPASFNNIKKWYAEKWQDWQSYGDFVNKNLKPGTLFFFPDQCFQHHASAYVNKETEYKIFHPYAGPEDKRTVWVTTCCESTEMAENKFRAFSKDGFKLILDVYSYGRIYQKEIKTNIPLLIEKSLVYYDTFDGYEKEKSYKFVADSYAIKNLTSHYSSLRPSVSGEEGYIIYKLRVPGPSRIKSLLITFNCNIGKSSRLRVLVGDSDNNTYEEVKDIKQSGEYSIDISDKLKKRETFYIKFELFTKRLPEDFVDALEKISFNDVKFEIKLD